MNADSTSSIKSKTTLFICLVLAGVLLYQMVGLVAAASSRNLMFDGAMNLEISRSIAEGLGPRRAYDSGDLFPPGVQSKEPFVLMGAAIFKVFGVGHWQAQLPNLLFVFLLAGLVFALLRRTSNTATALVAQILVFSLPGFTQYALNGYGEIPTLFFGLSALAVVVWPHRITTSLIKISFAAGAMAGLAMATKVVGIVLVGAVALILGVRVLVEAEKRFKSLLATILAFSAGLLLPLLLIEAWRWFWLGTDGYRAWWDFQYNSIMYQSGAAPRVDQPSTMAKVATHFSILVRDINRTWLATIALAVAPLVALALASPYLRAADRRNLAWLLAGLSLIAALYFSWWFTYVPTEKAWLRYIYIALVSLGLLAAVAITSNIARAFDAPSKWMRALHASLALAVFVVYAPFVLKSLATELRFGPNEEAQASMYAANVISNVDPDHPVFGYGWYAAPTVQLHTKRNLLDLTDWPIGRLAGQQPAYLVADRATLMTGILNPVLSRYPNKLMMRPNSFAQVYEIDFANPLDPFAAMDTSSATAAVEFARGEYPLTHGMEPFDPMGGRFIASDSEVLLKYGGQGSLVMSAYMALPHFYLRDEPLRGRVLIEGCPPLKFAFEATGWKEFRLPLACKPAPGENVRVRILLDNVFNLPLLYDRQRAMLLGSIGFSD